MSELRVGGLALIVGEEPGFEENIGRTVTLMDIDHSCAIGFPFLVAAEGLICELDDGSKAVRDSAWFRRKDLIPIDGDPDAVVTDQKELAMS